MMSKKTMGTTKDMHMMAVNILDVCTVKTTTSVHVTSYSDDDANIMMEERTEEILIFDPINRFPTHT